MTQARKSVDSRIDARPDSLLKPTKAREAKFESDCTLHPSQADHGRAVSLRQRLHRVIAVVVTGAIE